MIQFFMGLFVLSGLSLAQSPLNPNPFNQIPAFKTPASPLDSSTSIAGKKPASRDLFQDLNSLTPCQQDCSSNLLDSVGLVMKSMSNIDRYNKVCNSYNESYTCIEMERKCGNEDHTLFETVTSGVRYMCMDQSLAFQNTIECIDTQSSAVQAECEGECNTKNTIMNMVMRSSIAKQIQDQIMRGIPIETPEVPAIPQFDQNSMNELNQMSGELCQVGDCVLRCIKNKFNARCEGSAGALLTEVFVRPIASMQGELATISPILGMFLPKQCNYIHSAADLQQFRMDPSLDGDLRRMYAEKEAEKRANTTETAEVVKQPMPTISEIVSPLDAASSGNGLPRLRIPNPSQSVIKPVSPTPAPIRSPLPPTPRQILPASVDSGAVETISQRPVRPTQAPQLKTPVQSIPHLGSPQLGGNVPQNPVQVSGSQWALAESILRFPKTGQAPRQ